MHDEMHTILYILGDIDTHYPALQQTHHLNI